MKRPPSPTQKPQSPPRTDRREARRQEILDAAYEVFATKGYRDTAVADIAKVLGIGHGTFYRYFTNKHDVFEQVLTNALLRVARAIASEDASTTETLDEYRDQVRRIGGRMLDLLDSDAAIPRLLFYEAMGISPELDDKIQRMWELAGSFTEAYLHNGKKKGFLRENLDCSSDCAGGQRADLRGRPARLARNRSGRRARALARGPGRADVRRHTRLSPLHPPARAGTGRPALRWPVRLRPLR